MNDDRYISVEQSIIDACREVREMRAGRLPEPSLEDFMKELNSWIEEELTNADNTDTEIQGGRKVLRKQEKAY